jgi:hypothetical protein
MVTRWSFAENCEVDLDPSDYTDIDYDAEYERMVWEFQSSYGVDRDEAIEMLEGK